MGRKINFTKSSIEALEAAPTGKRVDYHDAKVPGLIIQVTGNGTKTFYVYKRINNRPKRVRIGRYPDFTPTNARTKAEKLIGEIADGQDPTEINRRERAQTVTLEAAFNDMTAIRTLKPKTVRDYRNIMNLAFTDWKTKPLKLISKDMVATRHQKLGKEHGEQYANLSMRFFRSIFNFARSQYEDEEGNSLLPPNPVQRISASRAWFKQNRRYNYITKAELPAWFKAVLKYKTTQADPMAIAVADFLLLLMFTGQRRGEAISLRWTDIDLQNKTLTAKDTKNGEDHTMPLSDFLETMLADRKKTAKNDWVFPSSRSDSHMVEPRKHILKIIDNSGVSFTPHDLRRTFITHAEQLDISSYAVKRLVNHKMNDDVTAGYIVSDVERLRKPMQDITNFFLEAARIPALIEGHDK
ncbi:integrase [bacterium endosymbiont of Escarpia laminata]|nr:MAG: integrase [bacterium endosymbiont of Escarpia laminata]RLJ18244.1 MAG: integrase [bacterium endosymbiont of Escarpia laminata]